MLRIRTSSLVIAASTFCALILSACGSPTPSPTLVATTPPSGTVVATTAMTTEQATVVTTAAATSAATVAASVAPATTAPTTAATTIATLSATIAATTAPVSTAAATEAASAVPATISATTAATAAPTVAATTAATQQVIEPKPGFWVDIEAFPSVSFVVTKDRKVQNFTVRIESDTMNCSVTFDDMTIQQDNTFAQSVFIDQASITMPATPDPTIPTPIATVSADGKTVVEVQNVKGTFDTSTHASGSSKILKCGDQVNLGLTTLLWDAHWVSDNTPTPTPTSIATAAATSAATSAAAATTAPTMAATMAATMAMPTTAPATTSATTAATP